MSISPALSILVDTNLLIYAAMTEMEEHEATHRWLTSRYEDPNDFARFDRLAWRDPLAP